MGMGMMPPTSPIFTGRQDHHCYNPHLKTLQEELFKVHVGMEMEKDKIAWHINLMETSIEDRNNKTMKELEKCNKQFSLYYEKKCSIEKEIMNEYIEINNKRINDVKEKYCLEDEEKKAMPTWKDCRLELGNDGVAIVCERDIKIEKLCDETEHLLEIIHCGNYLKVPNNLLKAVESLKRRFEIQQTNISRQRSQGATEVYEYFKGKKRKILMICSGGKRNDLTWSKRKAAYWIIKTYGKELKNELLFC